MITVLTIKILFTIILLKKTIASKHYLQKTLSFDLKKFISLKNYLN